MTENETTKLRQELAQVKKEYDDFVYLVSHDLKAPIRAINNLAEWVEDDLGENIPAEVQHNLKLLRDRSVRLDKMLSAILDLSRVARMNLQIETIELSPFIENIAAQFAGEPVSFSIPANLPAITTYTDKLQTVMEQLFSNAINHNPGIHVQIIVTAQTSSEFIQLQITDNGKGILPEQQDKIFNIFYTGLGKDNTHLLGAGLTLIKRIIDFVGGTLELDKNITTGANFILCWPLKIIQKP